MLIIKNLLYFFIFLAIFHQSIWGNIYLNPFLIEKQEVTAIANVIISDQQAGFKSKPKKNVTVYFDLLDKDNRKIYSPAFTSSSFALIKKNKRYLIKSQIHYENNKYQAQLSLPKVERAGWYDLEIKIAEHQKYSKNAFQYLDDKFNIIFLIDNSSSMLKNDPAKKRFQAIKNIVGNKRFSEKIHNISVLEFSNNSRVLVPFVSLPEFFKKSWINTVIPQGDTNFAEALQAVNRLLQGIKNSYRKNVVIFLSDGVTNYPYNDEHQLLLKNNAVVFTIGFKNQKKSGELDSSLLKKIALETNGTYQEGDSSFIEKIYQKMIIQSLMDNTEIVVYPMKEVFSKNELVFLRYSTLRKKLNIQVRVDNELASPLLKEETIILPPLKEGRHDLTVIFSHNNKRLQTFAKAIAINNQPSFITIDFPLMINYKENLANQISFFEIFSSELLDYLDFNLVKQTDEGFRVIENFIFLESPFSLKAKENKKIAVTFDSTFLSTEKNNNYLLLAKTAKNYYAYEVSFSPLLAKKLKETESSLEESNFYKYLLIIFLLLFLMAFYVLYWRRKNNP